MRKLLITIIALASFAIAQPSFAAEEKPLELINTEIYKTYLDEVNSGTSKFAIENIYGILTSREIYFNQEINDKNVAAAREYLKARNIPLIITTYAPDTDFFSLEVNFEFLEDLARRKGNEVDIAFFRVLSETTGFVRDSYSYYRSADFEQKSKHPDMNDCIAFQDKFIQNYEKWSDFVQTFPLRDEYIAYAKLKLQEYHIYLTTSIGRICSCDSEAETKAVVKEFIEMFPESVASETLAIALKQDDPKYLGSKIYTFVYDGSCEPEVCGH